MEPIKILIVATSREQMGDTNRKTGLWLEELAVPYFIFKDAGAVITLASPKGGVVPLDPKSESIIVSSSTTRRFQKDPEINSWLSHASIIGTLKAEDFDLVYLPGGHGAMWDFPGNEALTQLLEEFYRLNKLIGASSHGVSALVSLKSRTGEPLMKGRQLTGYSNSEERISGLTDTVPFLLESGLVSLGAVYSRGTDFESHVVADGNFITGQNSSSAKEVAKQLLICLKEASKRTPEVVY
jgi:putative intracellular protease/amidase